MCLDMLYSVDDGHVADAQQTKFSVQFIDLGSSVRAPVNKGATSLLSSLHASKHTNSEFRAATCSKLGRPCPGTLLRDAFLQFCFTPAPGRSAPSLAEGRHQRHPHLGITARRPRCYGPFA